MRTVLLRTNIQKIEDQQIKKRGTSPIIFLAVVIVLTSVALIWFGWNTWGSYRKANTEREYLSKIEKLRGAIVHLDEVLTMSARMAAATGNLQWEKRYRSFEPKLDAAIKEALKLAPEAYSEKAVVTDAANIKLVEMENQSFDLIRQGHINEAKTLLFSDEYEEQKAIYAQGMINFAAGLSMIASTSMKSAQRQAFLRVWIAFLLIPLLIIVWFVTLHVMRKREESRTIQQELEKEIRESEERYRQIFDIAPAGIWEVDFRTGKFVAVNDAICEYLGYTKAELLSMNAIDVLNAASQEKSLNRTKKILGGESVSANVDYEIIRKNGSLFWVNISNRYIYEDKNIVGSTVVACDITERKRMEEALRKSEERLQQSQKMESIGTLAGGIAHDFNNILFPIVGHTEMLLNDIPQESPLRNSLDEVYAGSLRARDLVKQILTFSRQTEHEMKPLKVQLVIKEALKLISSSLPATISTHYDISNEYGLVMADPTQIHQIAMNLCTNAFHAMEETGGKLIVSLKEVELTVEDSKDSTMTPGPHVCLTVADTGTGIEKNVKDRMFDPYFTTKDDGKGTGLGLAVIHGIIKNHGGHISAYSEPGKGAEFKVYLPVIRPQKAAQQVETNLPIQKGTERILLVDDQDAIVQMIRQMLERMGYHATVRTSSPDALEAFRTQPDKFDLVITDMTMPNMTGDKLAEEMIKIRSDIPVILCTGFSERMPEEKATFLGIKGFLMKPVVMKDLSNMIREVLDQKNA